MAHWKHIWENFACGIYRCAFPLVTKREHLAGTACRVLSAGIPFTERAPRCVKGEASIYTAARSLQEGYSMSVRALSLPDSFVFDV